MGYYNNPTSICHPTTPLIIFLLLSTPTSSFPTPLPPPPPPLPPPLPPPPKSPPPPPHNYTLKPSITIIIGLLTTTFSITFLLLLYAKHCRRSRNHYPPPRSIDRDNSGIDRTIIDSLPVFRFGSLTGQKDGLECAVCLSRFDPTEILRLLPKCKHAFHVECVDTWLDSHSTCPLCRYRVDPEDIFLIVGEDKDNPLIEEKEVTEVKDLSLNRISGRHSSAGENRTVLTDTVLSDTSPSLPAVTSAAGSRRSLDSWRGKKKGSNWKKKRKEEPAAVGHRKDGALLGAEEEERRRRRRFEHRIVVGAERWSDVQPSDLLYLRSEMVVSDVRRLRLKRSRPSVLHEVNSRSVSEMTGLSRFGSNEVAGTVSRLLARLTEPKSGRNSSSSNV